MNYTINLNEDANKVHEDYKDFEKYDFGLYKQTWLVPEQTYADIAKEGDYKGVYNYDLIGKFNTDVTAICDNSAATGYEGGEQVEVRINRKVSTVVDGCFVSKGTVSPDKARYLRDNAVKALQEAWQDDVEDTIATSGTAFAVTQEDLDTAPLAVIATAKAEYQTTNNLTPNTFVGSINFVASLTQATLGLNNVSASENAFVNGSVGVYLGMLIIEANIAEPFYMYYHKTLALPVAKNALSTNFNVLNDSSIESLNFQVFTESNPKAGTILTWLHWNYGVTIIQPLHFYVATITVLP